MTIEEMIDALTNDVRVQLDKHETGSIIATLRAGQAMRDNPGSAKAMYEWDQATRSRHVD